jgi:protein O-GlcNAc transferase
MQDLSQVFDQAADLHQKGDLAAAESLYLRLLETRPDHFEALQMFCFLRYQQGRFLESLSLMGAALKTNPNSPTALLNYAIVLDALQRREEALAYYDKALEIKPDYAEALFNRGTALRELKRPAEALASFDKALAIKPDDAEALNNRGNALRDLDRPAEAVASYDRALAIKPDYIEALNNRGSALRSLNRPAEALASYDMALAINPNDVGALYNRGNALQDLARHAEALASYDRALAIKPNYIEAFNNRGNALQKLKRPGEALASFDQALAIKPDSVEALNNRGGALQDLKRPAEALANFDQALAIVPDYAEALYNRGKALQDLRRNAEALASYDKALAIKPDNAEAHNNRGNALQDLKRTDEALASFDKALTIRPDYGDALYNRGLALRDLRRPAEALASFDRALAIEPDHRYAFGGLADAALTICDWARSERLAAELEVHIALRSSIISPFTLLGYGAGPSLQLECARMFIEDKMPAPTQPLWNGAVCRHEKLRVAYLSADFREHPVAFLMVELFELHDRARFEILGISFGSDDQSEIRSRLIRAFDRFHDVRSKTDLDVAKLLSDLQVDIAIDLNGHTEGARLGILAHRPAPVQASYLGYASTTGAEFIDYAIADEIVLPFDQQPFYTEKIVHLPDCFLVNDAKKAVSSRTPTRREAGLPDDGFVFCSFNNSYKITPSTFDVWMRLLKAVDGSVLWLSRANDEAAVNLHRQATARGVDPARLIFAPKVARLEDHLARNRLADLFLDTLPYNAHTTASDALWAGLPLLTCRGASFAGRVATSLLHAAGLPELATRDLGAYEALALRLATDASLLRSFRQRLEQNRSTCALFDTDRSRRHMETAYTTMWDIRQRGESPRSFSVEP